MHGGLFWQTSCGIFQQVCLLQWFHAYQVSLLALQALLNVGWTMPVNENVGVVYIYRISLDIR